MFRNILWSCGAKVYSNKDRNTPSHTNLNYLIIIRIENMYVSSPVSILEFKSTLSHLNKIIFLLSNSVSLFIKPKLFGTDNEQLWKLASIGRDDYLNNDDKVYDWEQKRSIIILGTLNANYNT